MASKERAPQGIPDARRFCLLLSQHYGKYDPAGFIEEVTNLQRETILGLAAKFQEKYGPEAISGSFVMRWLEQEARRIK